MGKFRILAFAAAALFGLLPSLAAHAADYPEPPVISYPPPPVEIGSGWYLRGDIGFKMYGTPSANFNLTGYGDMANETISNTGVVGVGFGYTYNSHFRTDVTFDYEWPGEFHGELPCPGGCASPGFSNEFADISIWTGLVNGYFDLFTAGGFTPYIGAGAGFSVVTTSNNVGYSPATPTTPDPYEGASKANFAWALMAGFGYQMSPNWILDVNYRYAHLGSGVSGDVTVAAGTAPVTYDNLTAQEIRFGIRYLIN